MDRFFLFIIFRSIVRSIGQYSRYYFFKLIGKPHPMKSLSNQFKDQYKDLDKALSQDFLNALIGTIIFFIIRSCLS